jgi:hypothetical protein
MVQNNVPMTQAGRIPKEKPYAQLMILVGLEKIVERSERIGR